MTIARDQLGSEIKSQSEVAAFMNIPIDANRAAYLVSSAHALIGEVGGRAEKMRARPVSPAL